MGAPDQRETNNVFPRGRPPLLITPPVVWCQCPEFTEPPPPRGVSRPNRHPLAHPARCGLTSPCAWPACFGPPGLPQRWTEGLLPDAEKLANLFGGPGIDAATLEILGKGLWTHRVLGADRHWNPRKIPHLTWPQP